MKKLINEPDAVVREALEGVEAAHGDKVRVTYEAHVAAPFAAPGWAARLALRHDVPAALLALRRESLARASHDP